MPNNRKGNPKILLVEGATEVRLIPELMEQNGINWENKKVRVVEIKDLRGYKSATEKTKAEVTIASKTIKFGIWMMPDNRKCGMLETFLAYLLPDKGDTEDLLWGYTEEAIAQAKQKGAPFKDVHRDKAKIHTWLAWQNEPGRQLHQAVKQRILDPNHPRGEAFVRWFKALYDL